MPNVVILAGPNGAGKTSAAPTLLQDELRVADFVNADAIARGLSGRLHDPYRLSLVELTRDSHRSRPRTSKAGWTHRA